MGIYAVRCIGAVALSPTDSRNKIVGQHLANLFECLGTTFVKIGQILSSRPDLIPAATIRELTRLQDSLTPFSEKAVRKALVESLGCDWEHSFDSFDFSPISSASVAQVHRATLRSGESVAVKIRRPDIDLLVKADVGILNRLSSIVGALPGMQLIPLKSLIMELSMLLEEQLDFQKEVANLETFAHNFAGNRLVVIPRSYPALCTKSIITLQYIEGLVKLSDLDASSLAIRRSALVGLRALYQMVFDDGIIHADMHPGNVFFREDGSVVLLDFGFVAHLQGDIFQDFRDFFLGLVANNGRRCAGVLMKNATYRGGRFSQPRFEKAMVSLISQHASKSASEFEVTHFAVDLFKLQWQEDIRGSTAFTTTIVSFLVFEGIVKQIDPSLDFQAEALWHLLGPQRAVLLNN